MKQNAKIGWGWVVPLSNNLVLQVDKHGGHESVMKVARALNSPNENKYRFFFSLAFQMIALEISIDIMWRYLSQLSEL